MRSNSLKTKLYRGDPALGVFCNIPSPGLVELLGWLGYDFVILDAEHGPPSIETVEHLNRAAESSGTISIARIAVNLPQNILRYLDSGCLGIQIPMVSTREEAETVIAAAKYPPLGRRGLAAVRAAEFGITKPLQEYVIQANKETLVTVQIETVDAIDNLDAILEVPEIDVIFFGPTDLSTSMGYSGQPTHPKVVEMISQVGKRSMQAGKIVGTIARTPTEYAKWRSEGFQYLCTATSSLFISAAQAHLESCRLSDESQLKATT